MEYLVVAMGGRKGLYAVSKKSGDYSGSAVLNKRNADEWQSGGLVVAFSSGYNARRHLTERRFIAVASQYRTQSMTAFARVQSEVDQAEFTWELRSVNHRYLDTHFKLPDAFRFLEMALRDRLRARLARGKVDVHMQLAVKDSQATLAVNTDKLRDVMAALQQVQDIASVQTNPSAMQLLNWPGVVAEQAFDAVQAKAGVLAAFEQAIDQLIDARQVEGHKLAVMVDERIAAIRSLVDHIETLIPAILKSQHERLVARLAELNLEIDSERLAQEAVLFAQKTDVAEEIDRLRAHLVEVEAALSSADPCGRRLDFLMQELNREANTLASKSVHVDTSQGAVELKVLIEQIREQVQNIE